MSFLSFIKDPTPLVLIGGISGIGKTTVLDSLLAKFPAHFQQPISYTSRTRRGDTDRYIFVSEAEIKALFESGDLLNLDHVYGSLYGMSKRDVHEIRKQGKVPIKEVHPTNFQKIKFADPAVVTIVIENKHLSNRSRSRVERKGREFEEENWSTGSEDVDIVLNTAGLTPEECAYFLAKKLFAFRLHTSTLPHPSIIDKTNAIGYQQISQEFTDDKRVTTKNFHDASKPFWSSFFRDNFEEGGVTFNLLEIGPGNGWLIGSAGPLKVKADIYGVDIADGMKADYVKRNVVSSARSMPFEARFFDYVVASLADPFLYPEVFVEISRILKAGGGFAFTYPSSYWANNYSGRKGRDKTVFLDRNKREIEVYSICRGVEQLLEISLVSDLRMEMITELFLPENYEGEIAAAISDSAATAHKDVFSMPIVVGGVFRKG